MKFDIIFSNYDKMVEALDKMRVNLFKIWNLTFSLYTIQIKSL